MLSWMRERVGKSKDFKQLGCTAKGVDKFLTQTGITVGGRKTLTDRYELSNFVVAEVELGQQLRPLHSLICSNRVSIVDMV